MAAMKHSFSGTANNLLRAPIAALRGVRSLVDLFDMPRSLRSVRHALGPLATVFRAALSYTVALLAASMLIGGCSTVGGWFGSSPAASKPAELVEFKPTLEVARAWEARLGSAQPYVFSPASDGQTVLVADRQGRLARIELTSGRELWRLETGKPFSGGVGVGEGLALLGTAKGELLAYSLKNGQAAWSLALGGELLAPPEASHGWVAARGNDGKVHLVDARDGKLRWSQARVLPPLLLREQGHLLLTRQGLLVGHPGGRLSTLALANGAPIWEVNVAVPRGSTELERIADVVGPLAADALHVCAVAYQGRIGCFDLGTGRPAWTREFSGLAGVELHAGVLYAVDDRGGVHAFDKQRGNHLWKQDRLRDRQVSTPLALGRHLAVGDYQGFIHFLDAETGAFVARVATDGSAIRSPMLALSGGLVAQTANGGVYAFRIHEGATK